jgi:hypothetical protein
MTTTHKASLFLSGIALALFVANEFYVLAGWGELPLSGPFGATILTGFFALGLIVQSAKFIQGHSGPVDLTITLLMLAAHIAAGLTVWVRTKIMHLGLPAELPYYIIGLYWIIGIVEVLARYVGREMKLFSGGYLSPEKQAEALRLELADRDKQLALLAAEQKHTDRMLEASRQEAQRMQEAKDMVYYATCEGCGQSFKGSTQDKADKGKYGHKPWCKGAPVASTNGHKHGVEVGE